MFCFCVGLSLRGLGFVEHDIWWWDSRVVVSEFMCIRRVGHGIRRKESVCMWIREVLVWKVWCGRWI